MNEDGSDSSDVYEVEENQYLKDDPWDIRPEFYEQPPHDSTSYTLDRNEQLLFYQKSRFPIHAYLGHTESEVVITGRRVIITQADQLRSLHGNGLTYRMRQHVLAREKVAGYEAGAVQPRCCHLCAGLCMFILGFLFFAFGHDAIWVSLRLLNPYLAMRMFGGAACRGIGWCGVRRTDWNVGQPGDEQPLKYGPNSSSVQVVKNISSLLQEEAFKTMKIHPHASKNNRLAKAATSSASTFLEMRSSGSLILKPESPESPESSGPKCDDFPDWQDSEQDGCDMYKDGNGVLSCQSGVKVSSYLQKSFEARRTENNALHLSPLEACCVCGGGKHVGFNVGVKRIVAEFWPLVMSAAGNLDDKSSGYATRILMVGKAGVIDALRSFTHERLIEVGAMLAKVRTGEVVAGVLQIPAPVAQLLEQLANEKRVKRISEGLGVQPMPELTRNALDLDMADAGDQMSNQSAMDKYAWWAYMQATFVCFVHTANLIIMLIGMYLTSQWFLEQRYGMDRLYVVLKLHQDCLGSPQNIRDWRPFSKQKHKVEQLIGFYLPPAKVGPYRLREMATALLAPIEGGARPVLVKSTTGLESVDSSETTTSPKSLKASRTTQSFAPASFAKQSTKGGTFATFAMKPNVKFSDAGDDSD
jgi:hypothetical protein